MILDIRRTAVIVRLRSMVITLLFTLVILFIALLNLFNQPVLGFTRAEFILALASLYFLLVIYFYLLDLHYIYFNDDGQKLIFRYYSMRPLSQAKHSIEIPKHLFAGYELQKSSPGLVTRIILLQKGKAGISRYPAVSLSALSAKELELLLKSLDKYGK